MKRLGQHFLKNPDILKKISEAIFDEENNDVVLEIGPGHGELTKELRVKNSRAKIICIERDPDLIPALKEIFKDDENTEILEGDALVLIPELLKKYKGETRLVGNIPYYITGFLFRKIGESEAKPNISVFMIQKEVAERITADPPQMNRLAATNQVWADIKMLFTVPKGNFEPCPQVDSAVISLKTRNLGDFDLKNYFELARIVFQQPRKTLINNLAAGFPELSKATLIEILKKLDLNPEDRPQNLRPEDLQKLSSNLKLDK